MKTLESIVTLEPGILIKGLYIDHEFGNIYLNDKWEHSSVEPMCQNKYYANLKDTEKSFDIYGFGDESIDKSSVTIISHEDDISSVQMKASSPMYSRNLPHRRQIKISTDGIVGMSLGQNIILMHGLYDIYRHNHITLTLLHKVLLGEEIIWIELESKNAFGLSFHTGSKQTGQIEMGLVW